jgi:primosomal protein N' (replication factor Y)
MPYFVEVILPLALDKTFTYEVSEAEFHYVKPGMRIAVPFGKSKIYTALALETHQNQPLLYEAKEIFQIIDEIPLVNAIQLKHWQWMSAYYMCSIGEVYRAALPSAFLLESETIISLSKGNFVDESLFTDDEFLVFEALQHQSSIKIYDVVNILNKKTVFPIIQKLLDKKVIAVEEEMIESYKPKQIRYIRLSSKYTSEEPLNQLFQSLSKAPKQSELLLAYFQMSTVEKKPITAKQVVEKVGSTSAALKTLIDKGVFEEYFLTQDRTDYIGIPNKNELHLSTAQQEAFNKINELFTKKDICLLHGVTSSGKTEIYIKLIQEALQTQKQVLFLLPEIALTTQLVSRLRNYFGNKIAVFHSKYNSNERVEVWHQVLNQSPKAQVVIGARSALFLPFSNLGLVIVDEEHEQNFKQVDPAPRYHARDAVTVLSQYHQSKVLLGSATPSLETYFNTQNSKYGLVELFERYGNVQMPEIQLVDLKDKYFRKRMTGHFSDTLIESITEALSKGEQVILFQNRRGFSPLLECMTCGHIPQCPNCDVSLTYHKYKNQLRCHYCGHSIAKPTHCHSCSSVDLTTKGFGTEQIELELAELFSNKNILRMDQDTTRGKFGYEKIIDRFQNREVDILVGTQMLAKGLDFDNVSLVGVLNADNMLYFPDFRAFERSYQMLTQVSGRAGRLEKRGKVIIQTYNPNHAILLQVTCNDYFGMYKEQLHERQIFQYPPFYKLIKITFKNKDFQKVKESAMWMYQVLNQHLQMPILGPEEPGINRIRNEYIRTILIKVPENTSVAQTKKTIHKIVNSFEAISMYRSVKVTLTVDVY